MEFGATWWLCLLAQMALKEAVGEEGVQGAALGQEQPAFLPVAGGGEDCGSLCAACRPPRGSWLLRGGGRRRAGAGLGWPAPASAVGLPALVARRGWNLHRLPFQDCSDDTVSPWV